MMKNYSSTPSQSSIVPQRQQQTLRHRMWYIFQKNPAKHSPDTRPFPVVAWGGRYVTMCSATKAPRSEGPMRSWNFEFGCGQICECSTVNRCACNPEISIRFGHQIISRKIQGFRLFPSSKQCATDCDRDSSHLQQPRAWDTLKCTCSFAKIVELVEKRHQLGWLSNKRPSFFRGSFSAVYILLLESPSSSSPRC